MSRLASELLADIDKETVDFGPNFGDAGRAVDQQGRDLAR
jgi:DNA gyrase/topoisomerase IV subunit A